MAGYVEKGVIRLHEKVGHDIWRMQIELPQTAKSALPGQFIHSACARLNIKRSLRTIRFYGREMRSRCI